MTQRSRAITFTFAAESPSTALARAPENRHNAVLALVPDHTMLRKSIVAVAFVILSAGAACAQITPITSGLPDSGYNYFSLTPSYERPMTADDLRHIEIEQKYRETMRKIPDKKPSNDPWKTVRQTPAAVTVDRHRPQ